VKWLTRLTRIYIAYNKDSDEWFCGQGNQTVKRIHKKRKSPETDSFYIFPFQNNISTFVFKRILEVGINTPEFYEYSQEQKPDEFKRNIKTGLVKNGKPGN
jgi:hypothetical protein